MKILDEIHGAIVLSDKEIESHFIALGWSTVINAVAETFTEEAHGRVVSPPKTILSFEECNNDYRLMPSYMEKYPDYCGAKIISACGDNPGTYGLPLAMGVYLLNDRWTQKTLMITNAMATTAWRTAAASAVGVKELSNKNSEVLGLIGCGQQAIYHIRAINAIRKIKEILIYDIDDDNMDRLIMRFSTFNLIKASKEEIFDRSDIVVTMTPTKEPHMFVEDIPDREMMICAIGGDSNIKLEFEPKVLNVVDHFCDSLEQVCHTGMVEQALCDYTIVEGDLKSLGKLMIGKEELDESKKVKMFLSTGVALEDLAMAILIYNRVK